jgi:hypothetical protein
MNYQYSQFFSQIRNEVNKGDSKNKDLGLIAWAQQVHQTISEVKRLSSLSKRGHWTSVAISSRMGTKPVLTTIDAENLKVRAKQMQEFILRKSDKAYDPRTFLPNETYVYVVPHSHTDLGWLKTLKEYYDQGTSTLTRRPPHPRLDAEDSPQAWPQVRVPRRGFLEDVLG